MTPKPVISNHRERTQTVVLMFIVIFIGMLLTGFDADAKDHRSPALKRNALEMRRHNWRYAHACTLLPAKWATPVKKKSHSAKWR